MKPSATRQFAVAATVLLTPLSAVRGQPAATVTILHNFGSSGTDGESPSAALVQGRDGSFYGTATYGGGGGNDIGGDGTVFKITPAGVLTTLHSFTGGAEGKFPLAGLVQGSDGNFYGTTFGPDGEVDSDSSCAVFKITPAGALTTLHSFSGLDGQNENTDGINPGGLVQGADGNFYGTTSYGGSNGNGTVFKITPAGGLATLHTFSALDDSFVNADGADPASALIQGNDGNFYGTTPYGGSNDHGTVFKITPAGVFTTLYKFGATDVSGNNADGADPAAGLVQGSDGNFYGTTSEGGSHADGTVFQMTPAGMLTTLHSFTGADGAVPGAELVQGRDGIFYGTTRQGGTPAESGSEVGGTVFSINAASAGPSPIVLTTLHVFGARAANADGSNPNAALLEDSDRNFYGTTSEGGLNGEGTVFKLILPPIITSSTTATGYAGQPLSYQITATGNPTKYGESGIPAGLSINQTTGKISGTPTTPGTYTVTIAAFNVTGSGSAKLTLTVKAAAPKITSALSATATEGSAFSYQITATNSPTKYGESGIPAGLSINQTTGKISGTPTTAGTYTVTIAAFNAAGSGSAKLTLTVKGAPPKITSTLSASAAVGSAFSYQITATNSPTKYGESGLPAGLSIDQTTGKISGAPTKAGTYMVTIAAFNAAGSGSAILTLTAK